MTDISEEARLHAVRGESYRGWVIPYCGMGTLMARKAGVEIRVDSKAEAWIDDAWHMLKAEIDAAQGDER